MLEAPEAMIAARQLSDTVAGRRIVLVEAAHTPHKFAFFNGDPSHYEEKLRGKTVTDIHNYGGMVELDIEDMRLLMGDGANISLLPSGCDIPDKHQLLIGFDDDSALVVSVRMYAFIWIYDKGEIQGNITGYYNAARQKPQVMCDEFTGGYFDGLISDPSMQNKSVKAFLATGQTIPGLGNGVLQDILYNAGIHPKTKISRLSPVDRKSLYRSIKDTLCEILRKSGRNSETDLFGTTGGYVPYLSHNTEGTTCTRCGEIIVKESYLGGSIYYCTGCQHYR